MKGSAMLTLKFTGPIAAAVAGEITRLSQHPEFHASEGAAYKAAWDRQAPQVRGSAESPALNLCKAFRRDCVLSSIAVMAPRGSWPRFLVASARAVAAAEHGA